MHSEQVHSSISHDSVGSLVPPQTSWTALFGACYACRADVVNVLIAAGADIEAKDAVRSTPCTIGAAAALLHL